MIQAKKSSEIHKSNWTAQLKDQNRLRIHETWFKENTIDFFRHLRMYEPVFEILDETKSDRWLTVGDGRYGLDAIRMKRRGFKHVHATDITDELLKLSHEAGLLDKYSEQNAESLTFQDDFFDYALCKEAFHHFPRPYLGLYEIMRVSTSAVVLIEPQDPYIDFPIFSGPRKPSYEESDKNYVSTISETELHKIAYALNLPAVSYKNFSDFYESGLELELATEENHKFLAFVSKLNEMEELVKNNKSKHNFAMAIIWKIMPTEIQNKKLAKNNWKTQVTATNPYI